MVVFQVKWRPPSQVVEECLEVALTVQLGVEEQLGRGGHDGYSDGHDGDVYGDG